MYFFAMVLQLKPVNVRNASRSLSGADGVHAHAAVLNAISGQDPELGARLHAVQRNKAMSIALLPGNGQDVALRVTFMSPEGAAYSQALLDAISGKPVLRLGHVEYAVECVNIGGDGRSGISTWSDLLLDEPCRRIYFQFVTPTAITKRDATGRRFTSLYPEPLDMFCGLARRWQALEGPPLPGELAAYLRGGGCVVARHRLNTVEFRTSERLQIGFVGEVVYECCKPFPEYMLALNALGRMAHFTGVGYQTARGMGVVQVSASN
jgi:CRISPR/Cas system endoribonuclease Cas6 (RAMP superfamily)